MLDKLYNSTNLKAYMNASLPIDSKFVPTTNEVRPALANANAPIVVTLL